MRLKIVFVSILFALFLGVFAFLNFPSVMGSEIYKEYIDGYTPLINKGFYIALILIGAYLVTLVFGRIAEHAFAKVLRGNSLAKKLLPLIKTVTSLFIWIMAGIFILNTLGINITALITGAGLGGLIFALASKEAASNLFGSLSLIFSKNFKIGDSIKVKWYEGIVEEISLSYTRLANKEWVVIFMPNKNIVSETIENLSMAPYQKAKFEFDIPSSLPVKETEEFLDSLLADVEKLEKEHGPLNAVVSVEKCGESGQSIVLKIESEECDMSKVKRQIWMLIKWKFDDIKAKYLA